MSNLPERFLASWQAKQFSLRIGATSLMKLIGLSWARASGTDNTSHAVMAVRTGAEYAKSGTGQAHGEVASRGG